MANSGKQTGSYRHEGASRVNQPTSETAGLLDPETRAPKDFVISRRTLQLPSEQATTDRREVPQPRLAWERRGPTSTEDGANSFAGTPLYTREKVNPLTMIEQLRRGDVGMPLTLLDDFNGLPPDAKRWEFYQHSGHWQNRLIHGDSSPVMQSLIARDGLAGRVQMIYFDPPYGISYKSNFMTATDRLETKNDLTGVPFGDTAPVKAFRDTYERGIHSYLDEIHERLVLFRELLTDSGSLFVQIGDDNVHRLAVLCDEVFGNNNRVATITWRPTGGSSAKNLPESASYLLWYTRDVQKVQCYRLYDQLSRRELVDTWGGYLKPRVELRDGTTREATEEETLSPDHYLPDGARFYRWMQLTSQGASNTGRTCAYEYDGVVYHSGTTRHWCVSTPTEWTRTIGLEPRATGAASPSGDEKMCGLDRLAALGRLEGTGENGSLNWKWYEDEVPGRRIDNVWHQMAGSRGKRYTVQTSDKIIERCILMATDPGDLVLDPTCGSGVTPHMAERWGRRWIGIDVGRVSVAITRRHLLTAVHPWYKTRDGGSDPAAGFVTDTMQRVSAATLAYDTVNDPENTIHLVDRPHEDKKRSRLTGPFTVESSSPYSYLPFADSGDTGQSTASAADSAERLLEALLANPISDANGRELLAVVEAVPWPDGVLVGHEAECSSPGKETHLTAAVMIAQPDVTVTGGLLADAAAEARRARSDISELIVVGFAFEDATASDRFGPLTVHKVQASRDLQIPGLAKDPDAGALTLLGEPDIFWSWADGDTSKITVELIGYDTYDPATGKVRPSNCEDVDCWMIDTDHDRNSFFPRLVYLPGYKRGDAQIKNLVKSLGKDLDQQAADALCGLRSQPFDAPEPGHPVAVKIITRAGAEMTTVFDPQ